MGQVDSTVRKDKRPQNLQAVVVKGFKRPMLDYKSLVTLGLIEEGWPRVCTNSQDEDTVSTATNKDLKGDEELVETVREFSVDVVQKVD